MALGWEMMSNDTNIGTGLDELEDGVDPGVHLGALGITAAQSSNLKAQYQALMDIGASSRYPATMSLIGALITQGKVTDAQANINSVRNWLTRDAKQGQGTTTSTALVTTGVSWLDNLPWKKILVGVGVAALLWWALKKRKE